MARFFKHSVPGQQLRNSRDYGPPAIRRGRAALWVAGTAFLIAMFAAGVAVERSGVAPRLAGPYIEGRTSGHAEWMAGVGRLANQLMQYLDRGNVLPYPVLPVWTGARKANAAAAPASPRLSGTPDQLAAALATANPGDVIVLLPGRYHFTGRSLTVNRAGTVRAPITVRAQRFGTAVLEFDLLEGFHVSSPYWQFEDLVIEGSCATHDGCEHAFHVVGGAHHVSIRNNVIRNFNAHIKINGSDGRFPDSGQVIGNTLVNTAARNTSLPVTPIDLVAASRWQIEGNLIADFVKNDGDFTSYGAFAKGGGTENRFVRNVVICEHRLRGSKGRRVGLSFGGGGSEIRACRDGRCVVEHDNGLMAGNLIAACSDDGIYVNRSPGSKLLNNTVLDTAGVEVRFAESVATISGNLVDGPLRVRDDGRLIDDGDNRATPVWALYLGQHPVRDLFVDAAALDLRFAGTPPRAERTVPGLDLCRAAHRIREFIGAFDSFEVCARGGEH